MEPPYLIPGVVATDELAVGGIVTAHMRWPWMTDEETVIQTGPITAIQREPNGSATVTVNDVEFLAFPPGEPGPVWFTDYTGPVPPMEAPDDNPSPPLATAAAAAAPPEEEDVTSSLEPSPLPYRGEVAGEEPATENPAPKSAPPTPARKTQTKKGGKRTRKARTPRRKQTVARKSTHRVPRRR